MAREPEKHAEETTEWMNIPFLSNWAIWGSSRLQPCSCAYKVSIESGFGTLEGYFEGSIADHLYFSFTAFTTVGFGDIAPTGPLRLLAGMEAFTGFVPITWTASYLYLEMTRLWRI